MSTLKNQKVEYRKNIYINHLNSSNYANKILPRKQNNSVICPFKQPFTQLMSHIFYLTSIPSLSHLITMA